MYQEKLCCVRYIYKVKETNALHAIQSTLFHVSLSFRHTVSLCINFYVHFTFHNQFNTMIESNTD